MSKLKFLLAMTISLIIANTAWTQEDQTSTSPARDLVMIQLHYDSWNGTPDSINFKGINRGFNMYIMYDFPFGTSHFSFAPGLGFGTYNYYFDKQRAVVNEGNDQIQFEPYTGNMEIDYKKSKLALAYLEAPFELRYFANKLNRNRGFKAALGLKVGYHIDTHTKDRVAVKGPVITQKAATKQYSNQWSFAPTLRLGWGNFSVYGQYGLSSIFKSGVGPEVFPWSIGIAISGL